MKHFITYLFIFTSLLSYSQINTQGVLSNEQALTIAKQDGYQTLNIPILSRYKGLTSDQAKILEKLKLNSIIEYAVVDPVNQINTVNQANPIDPINPVNRVDPVDPINQINPVDQINQVNQINPVDPVNPVNPINQVNQTNQVNQINQVSPPDPVNKKTRKSGNLE